MLRKAIFSLVAVLAMGAVALPSQAATQLSWNDISSQLTTRTNRPIWAMAYANGSWFYTDGQDLWNGGQVYRYDGYTQLNITAEVRNAGISRVDDIVSDGQMVLFLKNITSRSTTFEVLAYNGSYSDRTWTLRSQLSSDEGLASIVGKNGSWMIVTSKGRVFAWDGSTNSPTSVITNTSSYASNIAYSVRHVSPSDDNVYLPTSVMPTTDGWLIAVRESSTYTRFWKRSTNGTLTDVSNAFGTVSTVLTAASNGSSALLAVNNNGSTASNRVLSYDGYTVRDVTSILSTVPTNSWYRTMITWDGTNWLIIAWNKDIYTYDGSSSLSLGRSRDYVVTIAGNTNKTFLVGGAESTDSSNSPNFPLTAKLTKATEDIYGSNNNNNNGTSYGTGQTVTSAYGPSMTTSGNPSDFRVGNGGTFIYRATASDTNGVDRIDLYANGVRIKTCYSDVCDFEAQYYTNGQTSRTMPFSARATDRLGNSTDLPRQDILTIDQSSASANNSNTNNNNNQNGNSISAWSWVDPNQTTVRRDQTLSFNTSAWASNGLAKIEIVVNGTTRRTCDYNTAYGNQTCTYNLYGGDYGVGTVVAINAKATATNGQTYWTNLTNVTVTDTNGSTNNNNNNQNNNTSVWAWSSPETTDIKTNASASYNVTANDTDGIQKIEMYLNGSIKNTCNFGSAYGNRDCSVTINGSSYSAGSDIYVNAKITDSYGNVTWSNARNYHIVAVQTSTNSATAPTSWIWTTGSVTTLSQNQTATFNVGAWDADGISRIDIWVNGQVKKSCNLGAAYGNQECAYTVNANDYVAGTSVFVNAMIADTKGQIAWSDSKSYSIVSSNQNGSNGNGSSNNLPGSISVTSNRDGGYRNGETITFNASANDQNGIDRIELYVNGTRVKTCYNTASCSWTGGPYNARNYVNYGATIVDKSGYAIWTGYKAIAKI